MIDNIFAYYGEHYGVAFTPSQGGQVVLGNLFIGYPYLSPTSRSRCGGAQRQASVNIPKDSTIVNATISVVADTIYGGNIVRSRITGHKDGNATLPTSLSAYKDIRGIVVGGANNNYLTTANVTQDGIAASDSMQYSPNIASIITEIINLPSWNSGNPIQLFQDDNENRSTENSGVGRQVAIYHLNIQYYAPQTYKIMGVVPDKVMGISKSSIAKIFKTGR